MSGFSAEWLALREPADVLARAPELLPLLPQLLPGGSTARIVDLGSGTGANYRYLAPRLAVPQDWLLVDQDESLLDQARSRCRGNRLRDSVATQTCDLAGGLAELPLRGASLLTASALLDLVSEAWLVQLADLCLAHRLPVLFALTYDGRLWGSPADPDDEEIRAALNAHQRGDKGFGPALGPLAAQRAQALFAARGYRVATYRSDWQLSASDCALQRALLQGWASAAAEQCPDQAGRVAAWHARRLQWVQCGRSALRVGHEDLLGLPPAAGG